MHGNHTNKAFTLIELSIVVVIIGLIVAGVVAGQSLVKQAKLRNVISEINQYDTAVTTFQMQYNAIPGDMSNASSYWAGCGVGATDAQCNGDGSRYIFNTGAYQDIETFRAWQHLALAGLISGSFTGEGDNSTDQSARDGSNSPLSSVTGGIYSFRYDGDLNTHLGVFTTPFANYLWLGAFYSGNIALTGLLLPSEGFSIDSKMDDGGANSGRVYGTNISSIPAGSSCVTGTLNDQEYRIVGTNQACLMQYRLTISK